MEEMGGCSVITEAILSIRVLPGSLHGVPSLLVSSQVEVPIKMWGKLLAICETLIKYFSHWPF